MSGDTQPTGVAAALFLAEGIETRHNHVEEIAGLCGRGIVTAKKGLQYNFVHIRNISCNERMKRLPHFQIGGF
jgi:hypothetical protein